MTGSPVPSTCFEEINTCFSYNYYRALYNHADFFFHTGDGPYSSKKWPDVEKDHAAMITCVLDRHVGVIMSLLQQLGLQNDTIVFFASDNGAHDEGGHDYKFFDSSGPLRGFKRSLYEVHQTSMAIFRSVFLSSIR